MRPDGTPQRPLSPEKRGLGLGAREAELPGIARGPPGRVIVAQGPEPLGDASLVQPFDGGGPLADHGIEPVGADKLDRAGAVFADMGEQRERIAGRHLKALRPAGEHGFVVGQQVPEEGLDRPMAVFGRDQGH